MEKSKSPVNFSSHTSSTSFPVMINSKTSQRNTFHWKKFSYQSPDNKGIKESLVPSSTFQVVIPGNNCELVQHKHLETLKVEPTLSVEDSVYHEKKNMEEVGTSSLSSSQASSLYSETASIDNESFDLTPSLATTSESAEVTPLRDATNSPSEPHHSVSDLYQSFCQINLTRFLTDTILTLVQVFLS